VNAVAPEMAVATEGATAMMELPAEWLEPIEALAEASLALATCDPARENGLVVKSLSYLRERGRTIQSLDGRGAVDMTDDLDGRVALVTGGGSGIGRATALVLGARGASVAVADIDEASARETAAQIGSDTRTSALRADVTDSASVEHMVRATVERFGAIDCCNVAGVSNDQKPFTDHTLAECSA
jgi:hypothetical protein